MTAWPRPPAGGPDEPGTPDAPAPDHAGSFGYPGEFPANGEPGQATAISPPQTAGEGPAAVAGLYLASGLTASDVEPITAELPSLVPVATAMRRRESLMPKLMPRRSPARLTVPVAASGSVLAIQ